MAHILIVDDDAALRATMEEYFTMNGHQVTGIDSGAAALAKVRAGANLVQLYSALVFRGLGLVGEIKSELIKALERGEARTLAVLVGLDAADITAQPRPQ